MTHRSFFSGDEDDDSPPERRSATQLRLLPRTRDEDPGNDNDDIEERRRRRDMLVLAAEGLVQQRASYYAARFSGCVEHDDLVSIGTFALLRAANSFDPSYNASWSTYAYYWINGAMLREVRSNRRRVRRERAMFLAAYRIQASYRGVPNLLEHNDAELASELVAFFASNIVGSMLAAYDEEARNPETEIEETERAAELRDAFAATLRAMRVRDKRVLWLVYHEGYDIDEAAARLGVSLATAYRRHARAIEVLRSAVRRLDIMRPPRVARWPLLDVGALDDP